MHVPQSWYEVFPHTIDRMAIRLVEIAAGGLDCGDPFAFNQNWLICKKISGAVQYIYVLESQRSGWLALCRSSHHGQQGSFQRLAAREQVPHHPKLIIKRSQHLGRL